ncbi:CRISPR system precrRNA processing endoribonuclease RAMP protein Cas6 [Armatimonas sp.]|uniref:CRISPR system precrRNA processing endoribonuclease RAMP protein Cas6 n=1 Tax=Armatimonas sp. TaxID=1872638 RepID=UPI003753BAFA
MLVRLRLRLDNQGGAWWSAPENLRELALAVAAAGDGAFAAQLRESQSEKPLTVALTRQGDERQLLLTAFSTEATRALITGSAAVAQAGRLHWAGRTTEALGYSTDSAADYEDIWNASQQSAASPCVLRFHSPTAFSQGGNLYLPLPVPSHLFGSWARRWNLFCPEHLRLSEEKLSPLTNRVAIDTVCDLRTHTRRINQGNFIGFTGTVQLTCHSEEARAVFAALTTLSTFCGTGTKTMMGMGSTGRV